MTKANFKIMFCSNKCCIVCAMNHYNYRIYIEDENLGNISVTNDIENVLSHVNLHLISKNKGKLPTTLMDESFIFYKDSMGEYAQVVLPNRFKGFAFDHVSFKYMSKENAKKAIAKMTTDIMLNKEFNY